jgi:hypothetical protein
VGLFHMHISRRTGLPFFFEPTSKVSVWPDASLPAGWASGRDSDRDPWYFVNLYTGIRQHDRPTVPAVAPGQPAPPDPSQPSGPSGTKKRKVVEGSDEPLTKRAHDDSLRGHSTDGGGGGRSGVDCGASDACGGSGSGSGGGGGGGSAFGAGAGVVVCDSAGSEASAAVGGAGADTLPDFALGDSPLLALVRQEQLSKHHRGFAAAVASQWPPSKAGRGTKTVSACEKEGLLPGLQGLHARFIAAQLRVARAVLDPLLPYAPTEVDRNIVRELELGGFPADFSRAVVTGLAAEMGKASQACAHVRATLATQAACGCLPMGGSLRLVRLPASLQLRPGGDVEVVPGACGPDASAGKLALVFEPDKVAALEWLMPPRAACPVDVGSRRFGPMNMPLYTYGCMPKVVAELHSQGVSTTAFTSVLLLNDAHYGKLALEYRLAAARVVDPKLLPAAGDEHCLLQATALEEALAAGAIRSDDGVDGVARQRSCFLQRLYCVVARYETFAGNTSGLQGALPHHVFDALERLCGVSQECFASPLNSHFPVYCSAFPDTDSYFGSQGSFFADFAPASGCFEANPPFVNDTMLAMAEQLDKLLLVAAAAHTPLLFFVIVPSWTDAKYFSLLENRCAPLGGQYLCLCALS